VEQTVKRAATASFVDRRSIDGRSPLERHFRWMSFVATPPAVADGAEQAMVTLRSKWACCASMVAKENRQNFCVGKASVQEAPAVRRLNIYGDGQGDLAGTAVSAGLAAVYQKHSPNHRLIRMSGLQQTFVWLCRAANAVIEQRPMQGVLMNATKETEKMTTGKAQIRLTRSSAAYWRITFDNPPLNVLGPQFVREFGEILAAIEADGDVKVVVLESAVEGFFLNHSDFLADMKELTNMPQGPTGLEAWPDILVRITRAPVVWIALIRGRATGNGSEIALACDMTFASREKAVLSQWEVGVGLVAGGGPMARLPGLMGRQRALEVLLSSDDIGGDLAEAYGYVNRSLPDSELDSFVDTLATRIASFDKWAIANTKRLVNAASLPPDVEIAAGWEACMTSIARPASQAKIKTLIEQGFHRPGDAENRLGAYVGRLGR
jgi:enoyl-CoA hydratase/carnithine racemase